MRALPQIGFRKLAPSDGAFYIYADVADLTNDSEAFCQRILEQTDIAITPGTDFDPDAGKSTLRFSFAGPTDQISEAVERLERLKLG